MTADLSPYERAVAVQHIGGFPIKAGAAALGVKFENYRAALARARYKTRTIGQGPVAFERAVLAVLRRPA